MPGIEKTFRQGTQIPLEWRDLSTLKSDTVDLVGTCVCIVIETAADVKVSMPGALGGVVIPSALWTSRALFFEGKFTRVWSTGTGTTGAIMGGFV